ncbi:SNF1-related protein kinase regulatory subunit beta-1-like isoform X5 [Canna indica]|uniref:SNF1-related protein kinase regulatory subunit beta-1-like isoform X5 n=1 Tax=Canna indica TaxID=4628 RepID=A0AAQ3QEZ3_9LILI|nr:SNF1-related protein kinase regulatory subunit beta-1-like isoform X5 [Canna indica]
MGNVTGRDGIEDGGGDDDSSVRSRSDVDPGSTHVRRIGSVDSVEIWSPESPGRSRSPLMFAPQPPVPPLQGAADVNPIFNQQWMNGTDEELDGPLENGIPILITWNRGGNVVLVEGSWDNWISRKPLHRSGKDHAILMVLPSGVYQYKFIVDGQLRYSPELPFVTDEMGSITNLLDVHDYLPENVESISEFYSPPSPDSSYSWSSPSDEDFAKEPPIVPSQLHVTVLGMQNTDEAPPKPQHVVLNHLFIEKGSPSQSMVALGLTQRFQSKYVTAVLYKPVNR